MSAERDFEWHGFAAGCVAVAEPRRKLAPLVSGCAPDSAFGLLVHLKGKARTRGGAQHSNPTHGRGGARASHPAAKPKLQKSHDF